MRIAIKILRDNIESQKGQDKKDLEKAIELIHSELYNYDQVYTNISNIEKAMRLLENGKTIQNGEGKSGFIAYFKKDKKYFKYHSDDKDKIENVTLERIKEHVENYTLETNHYFF